MNWYPPSHLVPQIAIPYVQRKLQVVFLLRRAIIFIFINYIFYHTLQPSYIHAKLLLAIAGNLQRILIIRQSRSLLKDKIALDLFSLQILLPSRSDLETKTITNSSIHRATERLPGSPPLNDPLPSYKYSSLITNY